MANTSQSRKRARQEKLRRARNMSIRTRLRTVIKAAVAQAGSDTAGAAFTKMQSTLDRAVRTINVPMRTAARIKRRVNQRIHQARLAAAASKPAEATPAPAEATPAAASTSN